MPVTRQQIVSRGLANRCPNCGEKTLFETGRPLQLNLNCPSCGMKLEKDEGFFLGAMALNYGVTLVVFLTPIALLWYNGILGNRTAVILAAVFGVIMPILLYRSSRSWQIMLYYYFFPQHLPANRGDLPPGQDDNG